MQLSKPFIKLPFRFDAPRLAQEALQFEPSSWMPHPNNLPGNSAIALVSHNGGDNNDFIGEKKASRHLLRSPYTQQVMASFNEVLARARFMKLDAGTEVGLHVDFNYHWFSRVRMHIPVVTDPLVTFNCGEESIHMQPGECWLFDSWRRHRVINPSHQARIHLVIDTAGSAPFWRLVEQVKNLSNDALAEITQTITFKPENLVTLQLERYSALPIMAPGECDALVADLINDFTNNTNNPQPLVNAYRDLLQGFAHDWRRLWSLYGHSPDGLPFYRQLIETTRVQLHPDTRALTTASNDIGVNAIFSQRVLNAAIQPEEFLRWNIGE